MGDLQPWRGRLDCLEGRFEAFKTAPLHEPDRKVRNSRFQRLLEDICTVVREAELSDVPRLKQVVEGAQELIAACLKYAYSDLGGFKTINTFAHSDDEPWIDDIMENAGSDIVDEFMRLYTKTLKAGSPPPQLPAFTQVRPWTRSPRPHPLSSRLSRFRPDIVPTATPATPRARLVAEARTQLTTDLIPITYAMVIPHGGSILALASGGGFKGRDPVLQYYLLGNQSDKSLEGVGLDPGLSSVPRFIAADEDRKLVHLANDDRIKSFPFAPGDNDQIPKRLPNVHSMASGRAYDGPISPLQNGRFARAGKGQAAVWDLSALETNQEHAGTSTSGSEPHSVVAFADDPSYAPATWHLHSPTGHLLCGERATRSGGYGCIALDVEHGGHRAARFLGHGSDVVRITTSPGDPNLFATAASDGYARLFDVRRPLPLLTVETSIQHEGCCDVVLVHPDGIPTLFTGGDRTQQIKMWDIREQECVYELSTGNNAVSGMAWDDANCALFVATECRFVNNFGERTGYRQARIPTWATWTSVEKDYKAYKAAPPHPDVYVNGRRVSVAHEIPTSVDDEDERGYYDMDDEFEEVEKDEIDTAYSADMRWPEKCFHKENYFGYAYDAGEHVLFRWHFKEEPDITQLPASTTNDEW
ncbi:hypothetical protein BD413DRAFT_566031 [Trametes elegans]|nr:hypothetical protein BD413DRAFT_566031 [Trametes elegans]